MPENLNLVAWNPWTWLRLLSKGGEETLCTRSETLNTQPVYDFQLQNVP